jgi:polyisoprenoid-binding protein YceI
MAAVALLTVCGAARSEEWRSIDGSRFSFAATFEGEVLEGEFRDFAVELEFDPDAPEAARLRVTVPLAKADMGDADMNAILRDAAWFDVQQFSTAVYKSTSIDAASTGSYVARGVLDLKGVQQAVAVPFKWDREGDGAVMSGEFALRRTDFGVGTGEWGSGDQVGLAVNLAFRIQLEPVP